MLELWHPTTEMRNGQAPTDSDASIAENLANAREAQRAAEAVLEARIEPASSPELAP